jgi:hypothetical protein
MIHDTHATIVAFVGNRVIEAAKGFAGPGIRIQAIIFDYDGSIAYDSEKELRD